MTATEAVKMMDDNNIKMHHSARARKYISRRNDSCELEEYDGKFGKGYKLFTAAWDSSQYCWVTYYTTH
jgi:hypothetical protein